MVLLVHNRLLTMQVHTSCMSFTITAVFMHTSSITSQIKWCDCVCFFKENIHCQAIVPPRWVGLVGVGMTTLINLHPTSCMSHMHYVSDILHEVLLLNQYTLNVHCQQSAFDCRSLQHGWRCCCCQVFLFLLLQYRRRTTSQSHVQTVCFINYLKLLLHFLFYLQQDATYLQWQDKVSVMRNSFTASYRK